LGLLDLPLSDNMTSLNGEPPPGPAGAESRALDLLRQRADQILNAIDDGVYCLDESGNTTFVNEAAARMLGYGLRELLGRPQHEVIHHHYADGSPFPREACPIYLAVTDGIQQRIGGDVFWKKSGEKLWVDYTAIPIRDRRRVLGAVVTFRDATLEQRAEEQARRLEREQTARAEIELAKIALEQSEQRYRALVEASGQFIWTNTPEGRMEGEQPGWSALTGQSRAEYEGFGWADAVHPEDAPATIDAWNQSVAERRMFAFEHRVRCRDGMYRTFSIRAVPVLNADGTIREWVGVHTDVTEQRRALAAAEHARNELRRVFEQAPAAIATIEVPSLVFRSANPRYRQLLNGRDVVDKPVLDALPELRDQPFFVDMLRDVSRTATPYVGNGVAAKIDRGDGTLETRWFDFIYQPLTEPNGAVAAIMVHAVEVREAESAAK
jgi:PAS domain S-box-containing protein